MYAQQAMDHDLRTDDAAHQSIKNLSASAEEMGDDFGGDGDLTILSNLLSSLEAEGDEAGPVTNILREMGIAPPRPT